MDTNWKTVISHVKGVLMSRGRSRHDAEDLVQAAFVKLAQYELEHVVLQPEAFLMHAAQNLSRDAYRTSKRHGEQVLLESAEAFLVDPAPAVEVVLIAREQVELLSKTLAELDPKTCRIFLAHRIDGMSYADIARENRLSISAVEKQIAKAALVLTRKLEGW